MRIGVRELRQHASRYLALVRNGEVVEVTDRGRLVARIVPVAGDSWDEMVAAGEVLLAEDGRDILTEPPGDYDVDASAELSAMRQHER